MRRIDRQISDMSEIESILKECDWSAGLDWLMPMSRILFRFVLATKMEQSTFIQPCHGKKIAMLEKNPRCCFEVDQCDTIIRAERPCSWGMRYKSVIGFGRAYFVSDNNEKKYGLNCIMRHYGSEMHEFSDDDIRNVCIIRINIDSMTGKKHD